MRLIKARSHSYRKKHESAKATVVSRFVVSAPLIDELRRSRIASPQLLYNKYKKVIKK